MSTSRPTLVALLAVPLTLVAVACGDDNTTSGAGAPAATTGGAVTTAAVPASTTAASSGGASGAYGEDPPPDGAANAVGAVAAQLADSAFGAILVDGQGLTLYAFTVDKEGESACSGDCATTWPPLLATDQGLVLGAGLVDADFGVFTRDDGTAQVTFHGRPLYRYAGDEAPGQTRGQGVGEVWYVVGADGNPIFG